MKENNNCGRDKKKQQPETESLTSRAGDIFYEVDLSELKLPELRFEGKYEDPNAVVAFLKDYVDAGMKAVCLCDTIGIADSAQVKAVIEAVKAAYPELHLGVHFHDTRGLGMVNTLTAMEAGVDEIQSTLGGLGGCPFAPGASGNLPTEDTVWMLNEMGYDTGISFSKILAAAKHEKELIEGNYSGHHIDIEQETPCKA